MAPRAPRVPKEPRELTRIGAQWFFGKGQFPHGSRGGPLRTSRLSKQEVRGRLSLRETLVNWRRGPRLPFGQFPPFQGNSVLPQELAAEPPFRSKFSGTKAVKRLFSEFKALQLPPVPRAAN